MSSETSSTARTSFPSRTFPLSADSACGKILVRLRTSRRDIKSTLNNNLLDPRDHDTLSRRDERYRRQCRQQTHELPAAEVFLQHNACQQHRDGRIERRDHDCFIEAAVLAGVDEQRARGDVEKTGYRAERGARQVKGQRSTGYGDG